MATSSRVLDDENDGSHILETVPQPSFDPYFHCNEFVIEDLLVDERIYHTIPAYCVKQAPPLARWMRRTLLNWLRDAKELTICVVLQWDLTTITAVDFVAPVVDFLDFSYPRRQALRKLALAIYLKVFHIEDLGVCLPSYVAAACILYGLSTSILSCDSSDTMVRAATTIRQLLKLEARKIREVYQILQTCFILGTTELSQTVVEGDRPPPPSPVVEQRPRTSYTSTACPSYMSVSGQRTATTSRILPLAMSTQLGTVPTSQSNESSLSTTGGSTNGSGLAGTTGLPSGQTQKSCSVSTSSPSEEADLASSECRTETEPQCSRSHEEPGHALDPLSTTNTDTERRAY